VTASHRAFHLGGRLPLYYEDITPGGSNHPLIVLLHGGGFTGSCYLTTPDGRAGWAYDFVRHGFRVIIPDWPGMGRSAAFRADDVAGATVVEALGALLQHLERPVILLAHSMSGPFGYRLVQMHPGQVQALVAVAPGPPGNIQPRPLVLRETDADIEIASLVVPLLIPKVGVWYPTLDFICHKLIGESTRFKSEALPALIAATAPIPVQCLLGRLNYQGRQLSINSREGFTGLPSLVVTGSHDADHPREADQATADWLRGLGSKVDYHFLSDLGITGNGHMLMSEENSREVADHIAAWLSQAIPDL
jgi:pimeloyl-ACP methyl ester carboxylesterase